MAGINLSQSIGPKVAPKSRWSDNGIFVSISTLLFFVAVAIGTHLYTQYLGGKIIDRENEIASRSSRLSGADVDRVLDFSARSDFAKQAMLKAADPASIFSRLESVMVPDVRLVSYEFLSETKTMNVAGKSGSMQAIAQQAMVFKSLDSVAAVTVKDVRLDQEGKFDFGMSVSGK